ncbi:MAG TPA: NfeD family protein [Anaerolineae bacterium]|nr:NfeD family protein [Anaerolineae bacterium]
MDVGQQIFEFLKNPNVAYILMIVGLWMLVIAVTTPGTGFAEVTAAIALVAAAIGLFNLTVNFAGILLIVLAFALFAVDVFAASHGVLTIGGVLALLFGSLLLFPARENVEGVSGWLIAGVTLASAGLAGIVLHALVNSLRHRNVDLAVLNVEGDRGQVRKAIVPGETGTVQVSGQLWTAEADEPLESGAEVVILRREGLTLRVARASSKSPASSSTQTL